MMEVIKKRTLSNKNIFVYQFVIIYSILISLFLISELYKYAFLIILVPFLLILFRTRHETKIYFIVLSIGFPVYIQFLGKDAATITTIIILFLFLIFHIEKKHNDYTNYSIIKLIYLVGILGLLTTLGVPAFFKEKAIRYFVIFLSCLFLFLLIIQVPATIRNDKRKKFIEILIDIIILVFSIQIFIGISVFYIPKLGKIFKFFLTRNIEILAPTISANVTRLSTLISGPEPTGEMLALLAPLLLYKYLIKKKKIYIMLLILFLNAIFLTATRSALLLFILGISLSLVFYLKSKKISKIILVLFIIFSISYLIIVFSPNIFSGINERFLISLKSIDKKQEISQILNRKMAWEIGLKNISDFTFFGHGLFPTFFYKNIRLHFHCLYLTIIYQMGWVGGSFFLFILFLIYFSLFKSIKKEKIFNSKFLIWCCFISMSLFFINEIKYEFNRIDTYQQLCWALFGVFYLVANIQGINLKKAKYPPPN